MVGILHQTRPLLWMAKVAALLIHCAMGPGAGHKSGLGCLLSIAASGEQAALPTRRTQT